MAVRNLQNIIPTIWVPPGGTPTYRITITRLDGVTVDDVTLLARAWFFQDGSTSTIGNFSITIPNPNQTYTQLYTGMEVVQYYKDYDTTAYTLRFRGRIEKPSNNNNELVITGRSEALFAFLEVVTKQYTSVDMGFAVYDLFNTYCQGRYDLSQINQGTGIIISIQFGQQPFWDCLQAVIVQGNYDCYVDSTLVVRLFLHGTKQNTTDAIVHDSNLLMVGDFLPDTTQIYNKVVYYGADQNGYQPVQTAQDTASQSRYGVRPLYVSDSNTLTDSTALANAQATLIVKKIPPQIGSVTGMLLATIQPGDSVNISAPIDGLNAGFYNTVSYKDELTDTNMTTTVNIEKEPRLVTHLISDIISTSSQSSASANNPYDLPYSYGSLFTTSFGAFTNTSISNGVLSASMVGGQWVSPSQVTTQNVTGVYVVVNGQTLTSLVVEISTDGGINYETVPLNTLHTITSSTGTNLVIRATLNSTATQLNSFNILYKVAT